MMCQVDSVKCADYFTTYVYKCLRMLRDQKGAEETAMSACGASNATGSGSVCKFFLRITHEFLLVWYLGFRCPFARVRLKVLISILLFCALSPL